MSDLVSGTYTYVFFCNYNFIVQKVISIALHHQNKQGVKDLAFTIVTLFQIFDVFLCFQDISFLINQTKSRHCNPIHFSLVNMINCSVVTCYCFQLHLNWKYFTENTHKNGDSAGDLSRPYRVKNLCLRVPLWG